MRIRKKLLRLWQHLFIKKRLVYKVWTYDLWSGYGWTVGFGWYQPAGALKQLRAARAMKQEALRARREHESY